ncbi:hypothetical protein K6U06_22205 [Acidiferrimicrobium sp. IK]|uniref:hypothetical protein n=1 Tax=Acidiferrimicrobium sp. IK TaxID=2871700 RepID=UPI0021CB66CF|nr:hypothetical protein [Acidiferrimicrobium sp. IK]MCU4187091.1 hypothetical protein [Acidiferrimicrobium sp. IK]
MTGDPTSTGDDPWAESAGHVGAAPAPKWGQNPAGEPPGSRPDTDPTEAHSDGAHDTGSHQRPPAAGTPLTRGGRRRADPDNPYWSPAFDPKRSYTRRASRAASRPPRYLGKNGRRYRSFYRQRDPNVYALIAPGRKFWSLWIVLTAVTLGLASPVPTVIAWARARQSRRSSELLGATTRFWLVSAVIWTVITASVFAGYGLAGANSSNTSSSNSSGAANSNLNFNYKPPVVHDVALGTAVTVQASGITEGSSGAREPVTVDVKGVDRSAPNVTKVQFSVCAVSVALDPLSTAFDLTINGPDNTQFNPSFDLRLPDAWYRQLPARHCLQAAVPFAVPTPDIISNVTFGIDEQVVWPAS